MRLKEQRVAALAGRLGRPFEEFPRRFLSHRHHAEVGDWFRAKRTKVHLRMGRSKKGHTPHLRRG